MAGDGTSSTILEADVQLRVYPQQIKEYYVLYFNTIIEVQNQIGVGQVDRERRRDNATLCVPF